MDWRDILEAVLERILSVLTFSAYGLVIMLVIMLVITLTFLLSAVSILLPVTIVVAAVVFFTSPWTQVTLMSFIKCIIGVMW